MLVVCLLAQCAAWAQRAGNTRFDLVDAAGGQELHFAMDVFSTDTTADGYVAFAADGLDAAWAPAGSPALPAAVRLWLLPQGAELKVERVVCSADTLVVLPAGVAVAPAAPAVPKDSPAAAGTADRRAYAAAASQPPLRVERLGSMGGQELYRLSVHPFVYDCEGGTVRVHRRVDAVLTAVGGVALPEAATDRMLVVAPEGFREGLQPFVRWKRQEGCEVRELYVVSNRRDSIRNVVRRAVERWPSAPMPYLLLVGDVAQIQAYTGSTRPEGFELHCTDLRYADLTGDYLPDLVCGRWPVSDTAQLGAVVRKTLRYEQCLDPDSVALGRVLLVAGEENTPPAPTTTNGQVNYVAAEVAAAHPAVDTVCYRNPASGNQLDDILADIGTGAALLNYTAHCTNGGWTRPSLQAAQVDSAATAWPTVWVNNCCLSNKFDGTCFGEQLLRMGQGGAVAVIGATNSTIWNEDYYWAVGPQYPVSLLPVYDSLRPGGFDGVLGRAADVHTVGGMLLAGNLAVAASGTPYDRFYWEIYCLLGDPSLRPHIGVPAQSFVALADSVHVGDNEVLAVATPGATVTLVQGDSLLAVAVADSGGQARLRLRWCVDTGAVTLTASGVGLRPAVTECVPMAAAGGLALYDVRTTDSTVCCRVANLGSEALHGVRLVLRQDSADLALGALLAADEWVGDSLGAQQRVEAVLHYTVAAVGQLPRWTAALAAEADTAQVEVEARHALPDDYPMLAFRLLMPDGFDAHTLLARSDYAVQASVEGAFDSLRVRVSALPTGTLLAEEAGADASCLLHISTPDTLTHLALHATLHAGLHIETVERYVVAGRRTDSFEEGMGSYPWRTGGTLPWVVDASVHHDGSYCMRSGAIDYRQTSDLLLDVCLMADDTVSYWARTSSEAEYDRLQFSIDGQAVTVALSGETDWRRVSVPVQKGCHTLRWRYGKDETTDAGSDCAWIDDVRLPMALWATPCCWFGDEAPLAIETADTMRAEALRLHPNPTDGRLYLDGYMEGEVRVFDLYGREVAVPKPAGGLMDLSPLPDGVYLLRLASRGEVSHHKLIIRH